MKSVASLMSLVAMVSLVACAHGVDDPTNDPALTQQSDAGVPSFGMPDETCAHPVLNGSLCNDYQNRNPGDFKTGVPVYQYSILCQAAAKTCLPWSVDPNKYSDTSWVYCCESLLDQTIH